MTFSVANQHVVVLGAARSGRAAARLLASRGARVTLADTDTQALGRDPDPVGAGIAVALGPHRPDLLQSAALVVLSPGVRPDQEAVVAARRAGVPVIGEIELASRWLEGRVVAITGTKGKSTTTSLTARMLEEGGLAVTAGGNLGVALSDQVAATHRSAVHVVEVSSFQLETSDTFHPWIAVLVNLSPDHLDRHASFEAYAAAKARIFQNQTTDDWAVVNADDEDALRLARRGRARRFDFALAAPVRDGVAIDGDRIVARRDGVSTALMSRSAVRLPGQHLLADVLAASAVGVVAGVPAVALERAVRGFEGIEHALELVGELDGVRFVNDSKATNVIAARRAIESFDTGVVAIMGGRYKGGAFEDLRDAVIARAAGIVTIGEAADRVRRALEDVVAVRHATSMDDAVKRAFALAPPGGVVLLAPGCSSFDMFRDYAERGRAFTSAVTALKTAGADQTAHTTKPARGEGRAAGDEGVER